MFEEVFPLYLTYGMTYDEFWHGDPWLAKDYRDAYSRKKEERNQELWLQGLYIYNAVSVAIAQQIGGSKTAKYLEEPLRMTPMTKEEEEARVKAARAKAKADFMRFDGFLNSKFGGKNG